MFLAGHSGVPCRPLSKGSPAEPGRGGAFSVILWPPAPLRETGFYSTLNSQRNFCARQGREYSGVSQRLNSVCDADQRSQCVTGVHLEV